MTPRILLSTGFSLIMLAVAAPAETIVVKGRDKIVGEIKSEEPKGIVVNHLVDKKKADEFIPAADLIDIHYDLKPVKLMLADGAYKTARDVERDFESSDPVKRRTAFNIAIARYNETLQTMQPHKYARPMIEFKLATLVLRQAVLENQPTDKAVAKLQEFKKAHPNTWQINQVMPMLAQIQLEAKDYKGAAATFQEMAEMAVLPAEVRVAAELEIVRVHVLSGNIPQAQKTLDTLAAKAGGNALLAARVKMARAEILVGLNKTDEVLPLLNQLVKENSDKNIKAMAHNAMGECLFKAGRYDEAKWEFLWVEAVFNQDKQQQAKALYFLWKTWEKLDNAERAQECRETLISDRQFIGTEYQSRALKETGK
jgi:hypothetical protein